MAEAGVAAEAGAATMGVQLSVSALQTDMFMCSLA